MKSKLRSTVVDLQVWFSERQVEILNKNKRIYLSQRKGREVWRQSKTIWLRLLLQGMKSFTSLSIHPFIHLFSLYLLSYFGLWAQLYFTSSFELFFPLLYRNSYPQLYSNVCCGLRNLYGGVGGTKRLKKKGTCYSIFPSPLRQAQQTQHQIKEIHILSFR